MNGREQQSQGNLYNTLEAWTSENLKNQKSKTVLITGANSGIGNFAALELGRRAEAKGDGILSVACHPGFTKTNLQRHLDPFDP